MEFKPDCRLFTGYKPCRHKRSCTDCPHYDAVKSRIIVVSLDAMGAVIRSTCLLPPIHRRYPHAHITWVTLPRNKPLLEGNPLIDRIITVNPQSTALLAHLEFDILYGVDKSLEAGAISETIRAKVKKGFGVGVDGVIRPFDSDGEYQYLVGLDDQLKFFDNQKAETQQLTETMGLEWQRDPYILELSPSERETVARRRQMVLQQTTGSVRGIIGYNTGCSNLFPYKKFTVERATALIAMWREQFPDYMVCLLGGPEDTARQDQMKSAFENDPMVFNSPTDDGLRSGILWMGIADMVFSGCSLGMHMAIGLKKSVVAWFGVSCAQEVDLYDNGTKLKAKVPCTPCWKRSCEQERKCFDWVDLEEIKTATKAQLS